MPLSQNTHRQFSESEMRLSNKAFRNYLLNDEESLVDDDGSFNEVNMVLGMFAKLYEEDDGPERVQKIIEECEQKRKRH